MKIVWNCFSPALTDGNYLTGATGGNWMPPMFEFLGENGHRVHNVSVGENSDNTDVYREVMKERPNVIVLIWRWPMKDYPARQKAYERQVELIDYAIKYDVPVLIHDEDLLGDAKIAAENLTRNWIPNKLTSPTIYSLDGYETLMFPWFGESKIAKEKLYDFMYIGNNYARFGQVTDFMYNNRNRFQDSLFYGNWLDPSPNREAPEKVQQELPDVTFMGRLDQRLVADTLSKAFVTAHFAKEIYCHTGFLTLRWAEAASCGTVAMITPEFKVPKKVREIFQTVDFEKIKADRWEYYEVLRKQRSFVYETFSQYRWLWKIEELGLWS